MSAKSLILLAALFLVGMRTAYSENVFSTSTSGTFTNAISMPGLAIPAGATYVLNLNSEFDPDTLYFDNGGRTGMVAPALVYGALSIDNGVTFSFSSMGQTGIYLRRQQHWDGTSSVMLMHSVVYSLSGTNHTLYLSSYFSGTASDIPGSGVPYLFEVGAGSFTATAPRGFDFMSLHANGSRTSWSNPWTTFSFNASGAIPAPIPEPHTYAMLLAGLGLIAVRQRRRAAVRR